MWLTSPSPLRFWCNDTKKGVTPIEAPVVDSITGNPNPVIVGDEITFSAALSGGDPDTYLWEVKGGTMTSANDGATMTATATAVGTPIVGTLTASNSAGFGKNSESVSVNPPALTDITVSGFTTTELTSVGAKSGAATAGAVPGTSELGVVTFSGDDDGVGTVDPDTGEVTAVANGTVNVSATNGTITSSSPAAITVNITAKRAKPVAKAKADA